MTRSRKKAQIVPIGLALPVPGVIEQAEDILRMAREGSLRSLVWAGHEGASIVSGFTEGTDVISTVGYLERMKHRLLTNMDDRTEHDE